MTESLLSLAKMIDHSLLHPTLTDKELADGCRLAARYRVATVCIKPYAVRLAAELLLPGTEIGVCVVAGFPHGSSRTDIKLAETIHAIEDGAGEVDMVVNIGKVLGKEWAYVSDEIEALNQACVQRGAILKVIFENDYLPGNHYKIRLCEICSQHKVAFVKTSTGYGFVKGSDGSYSYAGATDRDLALMRQYSAPEVQIKAAGGVRTLDDLLRVKALGVTRVGATATESILTEARRRGYA
ncbi:MAG: deoxyribose-phosphate aldolase [Chloroflexota bacterium]